MSVSQNIKQIKHTLPPHVKLVAVSKTKPVADILEAYNVGQRAFGENKVQEMATKATQMPTDIQWHFIGHLQTNKVKYIAPFVCLIHSIDSLKLLEVVNKEAAKNNRTIDCLLQMYIAQEETKFGLSCDEAVELLDSDEYKALRNIRIVGLMGMATFTDNQTQVRQEFRNLKTCFDKIKQQFFGGCDYFKEISMGMSDDYPVAVEEGSTLVRIGSIIFGERNYNLK